MELVIEVLLLAVIFTLAVFLRAIPYLRYQYPASPDTFFFLNKIKDLDYQEDQVRYPKLFSQIHRFLIPMDRFRDGRILNRLSIIVDISTGGVIYVFVRGIFTVEIALLTTLIFLVTPFIVKNGTTVSARAFGVLLVCISLLCLTLPFPWNWIAIIPMAMTLLSHRLSTQTLLFISPTLLILDFQIPLILFGGFLLAVLLSKGEYITILRAHGSAIKSYWTGDHFPNKRLIGIISTPSVFGFLLFLTLFLFQSVLQIPLTIFEYNIPNLFSMNFFFESLMIVWGLVCLVLVIVWIPGQSYTHLPVAAAPFAFLTALLAFSDTIFMYISFSIIAASIIQSLYFQLRFDHIEEEFIQLLNRARDMGCDSTILVPYKFDRPAEFFIEVSATPVLADEWTEQDFEDRAMKDDPKFALITPNYQKWFSSWTVVENRGQWTLFSRE
ncbi:MAG: hypothetical protein ACW98Y_19055 [Candidatus Thorarchaeota archaeon]|jgi:hypothetical protein